MVKKNDIFITDITDINNLGYGICRIGGVVTFVANTADGDTAEIQIIKICKDYYIGKIISIIHGSKHRIKSCCPVSEKCGGCVYQHISYEHELELKRNYVINAIKKNGFRDKKITEVVNNGIIRGYRNKVQYPVGDKNIIGYYANHSHNIIENFHCELEHESFREILDHIKSFLIKYSINYVKYIYLRRGKNTGEIMVCLVTKSNDIKYEHEKILINDIIIKFPDVKSIVININEDDTNVICSDKYITVYGHDHISDILCGCKFNISAASFYQVNHDTAELLYYKIYELAELKDGDKIVDLYCGAGTIGIFLTALNKKNGRNIYLTGIDIVQEAINNAVINSEINKIDNIKFICGDAEHNEINSSNVIIIDPPRKGCSKELIQRICSAFPEKIVYVSCNPDTLARDLTMFDTNGYHFDTITPFDMFPRTGHIECVVLLNKRELYQR